MKKKKINKLYLAMGIATSIVIMGIAAIIYTISMNKEETPETEKPYDYIPDTIADTASPDAFDYISESTPPESVGDPLTIEMITIKGKDGLECGEWLKTIKQTAEKVAPEENVNKNVLIALAIYKSNFGQLPPATYNNIYLIPARSGDIGIEDNACYFDGFGNTLGTTDDTYKIYDNIENCMRDMASYMQKAGATSLIDEIEVLEKLADTNFITTYDIREIEKLLYAYVY